MENKVPKYLYLILLILGILILVVSLTGIFTNQTKNKKTITKTGKFDYLEISKRTLNWLDTQRDERGYYSFKVDCSKENNTCDSPILAGLSGHDGLSVLSARFNYYQKTKDKTELEKLKRDITNYAAGIKKMEIKNDFWNCKLMYEIWNGNILNEEKYLIILKDICNTSTYYDTNDIKSTSYGDGYGGFLKSEIKLTKNNITPKISFIDPKKEDLESLKDARILKNPNIYASYPSDFVAGYKWNQTEDDLIIAKSTFNRVVTAYYLNKDSFYSNGICLTGISALDLYKLLLTKNDPDNQQYLTFAKFLYENEMGNNYSKQSFFDNSICGLFANQLYQESNDEKYKNISTEIKNNLIERYFDGINPIFKSTDEAGFFKTNNNTDFIYNKYIRENAITVKLLLE